MVKPSKKTGVVKANPHNGRRVKPGNESKYTTRNKALNRLQIKLPEFRRLCILKGIHPREPKKKFEGHNKTYYHVKDINFLAHEPLLSKSRDIRAYDKKVVKAKAKRNEELALRLQENRPKFSLDHLVRERYPSFIDALRDLDDPLTMVHLFATLPADTTHNVPFEKVHNCRRLSLEWQAYITRTHSLRKVFISVKGIYYQAEVTGQKITWLTPHVLQQVLPDDVDFRVMLTFAEFYETLMGFVNFKLYHALELNYPPVLDERLEQVAAELYALMKDLASINKEADHDTKEDDAVPALVDPASAATEAADPAELSSEDKEKRLVESQARLASLQDRLSRMEKEKTSEVAQDDPMPTDDIVDEDEETRKCRLLFSNYKFFLGREVPREALLFVIRAFGGAVSWDGDGAPFPETDEEITHQIVDRPVQGHKFLSREYVQPQWVFDSTNNRLILPTEAYGVGKVPPPHLSPFVDNEAEGHVPEYAETIKMLKMAAEKHVLPLPGAEAAMDMSVSAGLSAARQAEDREAAKERELAAIEKTYVEDLAKEIAGQPFAGLDNAEKAAAEAAQPAEASEAAVPAEMDEEERSKMMLPKRKQKLYTAMQMSKKRKDDRVDLIKKRKKLAESSGKK